MKIKVTLERPASDVDLVLTADADATVGDVAEALASRDPDGGGLPAPRGRASYTLSVIDSGRTALDPDLTLADSGIKSGARIAVTPAGDRYADRAARPAARITVLQGPDAGGSVTLPAGNQTIGRQSDCDVRLTDTLVSRRHVRVFLAPGSAEFLDLGSANGLLLNGEQASRGTWLAGDRL
jgi:DNA segregation ATPase FtsK/SpoIIIE, S-DNA-T family